jgi:hypothetical protein
VVRHHPAETHRERRDLKGWTDFNPLTAKSLVELKSILSGGTVNYFDVTILVVCTERVSSV